LTVNHITARQDQCFGFTSDGGNYCRLPSTEFQAVKRQIRIPDAVLRMSAMCVPACDIAISIAVPLNLSPSIVTSNKSPSGEFEMDFVVSSFGISFATPKPTLTPLSSPWAPKAAGARFTWSAVGDPATNARLTLLTTVGLFLPSCSRNDAAGPAFPLVPSKDRPARLR